MLLSILIPVYNTERYLHRCIESLQQQTFDEDDYEIIFVDDGSTDGSAACLAQIAAASKNVRIASQKNGGVSSARNKALDLAQGEFVCFVDSDDAVIPYAFSEIFYRFCTDEVDAVRFYVKIITELPAPSDALKSSSSHPSVEYHSGSLNDGDSHEVFRGNGIDFIKRNGCDTFCYSYFYRRTFLQRNLLKFAPHVLGEDLLFVTSCLLATPRMVSTDIEAYYYYVRQGSATTTKSAEHCRRGVEDLMQVNQELLAKASAKDEVVQKSLRSSLSGRLPMIFTRCFAANMSRAEFGEICGRLRQMDLLPCRYKAVRWGSVAKHAMNVLYYCPWLFSPLCWFYNVVFARFVQPHISRI